ncbi:hypothetical protein JAAARDRAFT_62926 [Jaapia argillacea MUCL 33604]|uniref:Uncharacterized protein n=1 Tax=Jaapia argillacea MUCL 33604 TaxID=933084 RepID=A0A067PKC6_9AGAM|nr:hypothetical protein JAAARDRAFT_62926 [Jaapia argillacea MUCL 33604]
MSSPRRTIDVSVEFEDRLDFDRFLASGVVESASDSDDTASDIPGPGRTLDHLISKAGRRLDKFTNSQSVRPAPRTFTKLQVSQAREEIDAFQQFAGDHSFQFETDSDETVSDLTGPGRTLGNALSFAGRKLQKILGKSAERFGVGPNAVMDRIVDVVDGLTFERLPLPFKRLGRPTRHVLQSPQPFETLIQKVFEYRSDGVRNEFLNDPAFNLGCKQLITLLRHGRTQTQYSAINYILAIICAYPQSVDIFIHLGALKVLQELVQDGAFIPRSDPGWSLLLAPSRRALTFLSENEVLTVIKEMNHTQVERKNEPHLKVLATSLIKQSM